MAEHKVIKDSIVYIIPNDELYKKYKLKEAEIDDYGRLKDSKSKKIIKELKHHAYNNPDKSKSVYSAPNKTSSRKPILNENTIVYSVRNQNKTEAKEKKHSPIVDKIKNDASNKMKEVEKDVVNQVIDWAVYKGIPDFWKNKAKPFLSQKYEEFKSSKIKEEKEYQKSEECITNEGANNRVLLANDAELEKIKVMYHWFEMLTSLKKLHDANEIDMDEVLAQLTDEKTLKRVNLLLNENPNLLETEKINELHELLGRDLYKNQQLIPIRREEIATIVEEMQSH